MQAIVQLGGDALRDPAAEAGPEMADGLLHPLGLVTAPDVIGGHGEIEGLVEVAPDRQDPRCSTATSAACFGLRAASAWPKASIAIVTCPSRDAVIAR
jgi:hypothetical protein